MTVINPPEKKLAKCTFVYGPAGWMTVAAPAGYHCTGGPLLTMFMRLWKNNPVSRKPCKWRSDLVLNGQMRVPK